MLQHRPFVDLGLEHVNLKTKTVQDMVKELQKNGGNLQNESVEVLRVSLGTNIELLSQLQYQKSNLYTPKGRPSTVGTARPLPGVPKPSLIQLMQQQQQQQHQEQHFASAGASDATRTPLLSPITRRSTPASVALGMGVGPAGYVAKPWSSSATVLAPPPSLMQPNGDTLASLQTQQVLSAPEVTQSLALQSGSHYVEELGRNSPTAARMLQAADPKRLESTGRQGGQAVTAIGALWPSHIEEATGHVHISVDEHQRQQQREGMTVSNSTVRIKPQPLGDPAVAKMVELALTEAQLVAEQEERLARELVTARAIVAEKVAEEHRKEREREDNARARAAKEQECRGRIRGLRRQKEEETTLKREAKLQAREMMLSHMESQSSSLQEQKAAAARARKAKILQDREADRALLADTVKAHTEHVERVSQRRLEELKDTNAAKAAETERRIQEKIAYTQQFESELIARRTQQLELKAKQHTAVDVALEEQRLAAAQKRMAREAMLGFQAEQRRRLIDFKRASDKRSGQIRLAQEKAVALTRSRLGSERQAKLNAILAEAYKHRNAGSSSDSVDATPGPGEYYKPHTAAPRGGYFASSRNEQPLNDYPGPGTYEVAPKTVKLSGVVPFLPRGKTDVDWTVLTASKLPGVGQYNIASRPRTSPSIRFPKKGNSHLDLIIKRAAELPGPGDYDLGQNSDGNDLFGFDV